MPTPASLMDFPFARSVINPLERPITDDILHLQTETDRALRDVLGTSFSPRAGDFDDHNALPPNGVIGGAFKVRPTSPVSLAVTVDPGFGFMYAPGDVPSNIGGVPSLNDPSAYKPLILNQQTNPLTPSFELAGIPTGGPTGRTDIVCVKYRRALGDLLSRDVFDVGTEKFNPALVNKTLSFLMDGSTEVVSDAGSSTASISYRYAADGAVATVPAGYMKVAEVAFPAGSPTTVAEGYIRDMRSLLLPSGMGRAAGRVEFPAFPATVAPALTGVAAPPGVMVVASRKNPINADATGIYIFAGGLPASAAGFGSVVIDPLYTSTGFLVPTNIGVRADFPVNTAMQTFLADPAKTQPTVNVALGQPCFFLFWNTFHQNGATTDTFRPDPTAYRFSVDFHY